MTINAKHAAVTALTTDQAKAWGIGLIVAVLVIGVLLSLVVGAIVGRLVIALVVIAVGALVWHQRTEIESAGRNCDVTFLGVHLTPSDPALKQQCQALTNR